MISRAPASTAPLPLLLTTGLIEIANACSIEAEQPAWTGALFTLGGIPVMLDDAQQSVMLTMQRRLFGYACALSRDTSSAEDLYQDTLLRAMAAKNAPDSKTAFRVWMFRIMRNLWIDRLRAAGRLPEFDDTTEIEDLSATRSNDLVVNALAVRQAFQRLSKQHRDILALVDICGFSYADTAEMLDVPTGTIMSRISRARAALAKHMQDETQVVSFPLSRVRRKLGERA